MKNLLFLLVLMVAGSLSAAIFPNKMTTNANPESVNWTNASIVRANGGLIATSLRSYSGNLTLGAGALVNAGIVIDEDGSSIAFGGASVFTGTITGNGTGLTNLSGLGFSSGAATPSSTNLNVVIGNLYQSVTLSANCNVTNVSGIGAASVKFLPGGSNRTMSFPTNWAWLNTNGFALVGSLYSITLTNGASKIGWLSVVTSGSDATNVAAVYQQTP